MARPSLCVGLYACRLGATLPARCSHDALPSMLYSTRCELTCGSPAGGEGARASFAAAQDAMRLPFTMIMDTVLQLRSSNMATVKERTSLPVNPHVSSTHELMFQGCSVNAIKQSIK